MCGIAGIYDFRESLAQGTLEQFAEALAHRGPDGQGCWYDERRALGLAHRRLSILDPSAAGAQPMHFADRYVLSYNGEVYNFLELRAELESQGHRFVSDTDSEVVLQAYAAWGADCLHRFVGMWAIAIYDREQQTLWLARDRFGIKPLHYHYAEGQRFAFASETIAFRHLRGFEREFDADALGECLADVAALEGAGRTVFAGISQLRAGHVATVTINGRLEVKRWYSSAEAAITLQSTPSARVAEWRKRFDAACALRMRSDVPLASAVSGGLDSSSVYATVHHLQRSGTVQRSPGAWSTGYVLGFPGSVRDERYYARQVVDFVGGQLREVTSDFGDVDAIVSRTRAFDSVFHNPNFILHDLYGAMAADGVKVSLDGHGADELMYGYPVMLQRAINIARRGDPARLAGLQTSLAAMQSVEAIVPTGPTAKARKAVGLGRTALRKLRGSRVAEQDYHVVIDEFFHGSVLPTLLRNFDRSSMAVGVEIRMPFMDHRVVEYTLALGIDDVVRAPYTKQILRGAMEGRLPEPIRLRTNKLGIMAPLDELFAGSLRPFVLGLLNDSSFRQNPYWDGEAVANWATQKFATDSWTLPDTLKLWPYLNAHLIR